MGALITVMLDIDGVLVGGRPRDGRPWETDLARDLGIEPEALRTHFFEPHWQQIVTGRAQVRPVLAAALAAIGSTVPPETLLEYWYRNDSRIEEPVLDWVGRVRNRGNRVYLCSNEEAGRARYLLDSLGLGDHVDGIAYSAAIGFAKPDRRFFDGAASLAPRGVPLLVDDRPENVEAAVAAGWKARLYRGPDDLPGPRDRIWAA